MNANQLMSRSLDQIAGLGQVQKETPVTRLSAALEHLRKAEAQVSSVASKLVGECPPEGCGSECRPIGSGLFGSIEEMSDTVSRLASDIMSHIERVERRL